MRVRLEIGNAWVVAVLALGLGCSPDDASEPAQGQRPVTGPGVGTSGQPRSAASGGTAGRQGIPGLPDSPGFAGTPSTPAVAGSPSSPGIAGAPSAGMRPPVAGTPAPGGSPGAAGMPAVAGMAAPMMPGAAGMAAPPPMEGGPTGDDPFAAERQACVDYINMYRATLMLPPLKRATPEQERCSDEGAKQDGDTGQAHSSAGKCRPLSGQNTCPGYPIRGGSTLTATLQFCLDQMWAEGEPPNGVQACIADRTGCFLAHGHWINMSMASYGTVACGFYKMPNGRYWMNQNFGR